MKPRHIIIILVIVALIAGGFLIKEFSKDTLEEYPSGTIGNTAGNINNGGFFCESEGKVYFSNSYDNGAMYVMNADESEIQKIINQSVKYINVAGTHMFYYQADNTSGSDLGSVIKASGLYRATTTGKHITGLSRGVYANLILTGNELYYQYYDKAKGFALYTSDLEGNQQTLVLNDLTNPACAVDQFIYYNGASSDHNLYRLDTRTLQSSLAFEGNLWNPVYSDGYLYYQNLADQYSIWRLNMSNGENTVVAPYKTESFNVSDGYIFFTVSASTGDPCLMRIGKNGENPVVLASGNYCNLSVTSRYLYYNSFETGELFHVSINSDMPSRFTQAMQAVEEVYAKYKNGAVPN